MVERFSADDEYSFANLQKRLPTQELDSFSPVLEELYKCDTEELPYKWQNYYKSVYEAANEYRAKGKYEKALSLFRKAQSIIYYVRGENVFTESMPVREAACSYMAVQCYIKLQREPDKAMRELHLMSEVLMNMLDLVDDGKNEKLTSMILELKTKIKENHEINIMGIYSILTKFWDEENINLTDYQKGWIWKLSYFLTRYATVAFDFYSECTPHIKLADSYAAILASINSFSIEVKNSLSSEYINGDPEGTNQVYAKIHRNWMPVYADIVSAEAAFIVGDNVLGGVYYDQAFRDNVWKVVDKYNEEGNEEVIVQDFEYALELLALVYFASANIDYSKYPESEEKFNLLYQLADSEDLTRIKIMIKLYQARIVSKHKDYDKLDEILAKLDQLNEVLKMDENDSKEELYDKWINYLRAGQILHNHEVNFRVAELQRDLKSKTSEAISMSLEFPDIGISDGSIWDILEIEKMFSLYVTQDAKIDRQRGSNLPLEAQIYYTLGRVSVEKAKVYGDRWEEDRSRENGEALLKSFYDARNYLCEAYSILKSMGYQEVGLLKEIASKYREMLDYNYTLSGLDADKKKKILPDYSEDLSEMDEIVKHYQIQRWTQIVFDAIKSYSFRSGDDYLRLISLSFEDGIRRIIPEMSRMYIVDTTQESYGLDGRISSHKQIIFQEVLSKAKGAKIEKSYFYHQKGGKLLYALQLDKGERRKIILETDIPLTQYSQEILGDVSKSVNSLLHLFESRTLLEETSDNIPEVIDELKFYVLKAATELFDNLFEVHPPTKSHSHGVAQMMERSAEQMKVEDPNCTANPQEAAFAGLLHDVGKLGLDPKLILDKASRLLPFEIEQVENHTVLTAKVLRGLLGLKHFKNVIAVASAHHVKYGVDKGYPVMLPGESVKVILRTIMGSFHNLTPEEYEFLQSEDAFLDEDWCHMAHDIVIFDQIQALRALDREYRDPMPIKMLNGYIKSRSGRDFDPIRMKRVVGLIKEGFYTHHLIHSMSEVKDVKLFDEPDIISWDDLLAFVKKFKSMFEHMLDIPIDPFIEYLEGGYNCGLSLSSNCVGAGLCEVYIQEEQEKDSKNQFEAKKRGIKRYDEHKEAFFSFLKENFHGSWEGERVPNS